MDPNLEVQTQNFALITLKERCHFLKQQLKAVDDENIKLKVQIANSKGPSNDNINKNSMLSEVEMLKTQKEHLLQQINILATENKNMWCRLSRLTIVNRNLTRRFTKVADTLEKHGLTSSISDMDCDVSVSENSDYRKRIEEMSLKLINNIKLEKYELEKQYSQMVDLHKNDAALTEHNLAFTSFETDEENVIAGVKRHAEKLAQFKNSLIEQQGLLGAALTELKVLKNKHSSGSSRPLEGTTRDIGTETEDTVQAVSIAAEVESSSCQPEDNRSNKVVDDQICPLCQKSFECSPAQFVDHVTSHFESESESIDDSSFVNIPNQ